jgi:hypothetical protein
VSIEKVGLIWFNSSLNSRSWDRPRKLALFLEISQFEAEKTLTTGRGFGNIFERSLDGGSKTEP